MSDSKNLLENLPESIDDMPPEQFAAYSDAVAKGTIKPIGKKEEETPLPPKPEKKEGEEESEEEKARREQEEADAKAKADADAEAKSEADKANLKTKEGDKKDPPSMSLEKYKRKKEIWQKEKEQAIADLKVEHAKELEALKVSVTSASATDKSIEEELKKFGEENNIKDLDVIKNLVGLITKHVPGVDPETKKDIASFKEAQKKSAEEAGFENDFLKTALPVLKKLNPNIDEAHLKEAKETLKKYSYEDKYLKLSLEEIISLKQPKFQYNLEKKKTAESSRPGSQVANKISDYDNWTADDIENASPEEFEKYSNHMASKSGSMLRVYDKDGKEVK